jgi:Kef-type K+ transport system membrane component KefB/voltage-gated potassium channel Kch
MYSTGHGVELSTMMMMIDPSHFVVDITSSPTTALTSLLATTSESVSTMPLATTAAATTSTLMSSMDAASAATSLGNDFLLFLVASVVVVPICKSLKIPPVLGFLLVGCVIGPYGMKMFTNNEGDLELGDLGILFLLFNEGLSLSPERIKELGRFTGLGVAQLLISIGCLFVGSVLGGPILLKFIQEIGLPLDLKLLRPLFENPIQAFTIASAGALSSSAFVLPFLKQKNWEEKPEGTAGLSILLLQDLAVAPLLVVLPLLAGSGPQSSGELAVLVLKATVGFGAVLVAGSYGLRYVFEVVATARSTETFVAATLLVAVGMGQVADWLGLSASTGAFAAGVLLAGNRYRAQIQADIKPFEGILLGVFFITAGAKLDPALVLEEWPTLASGIFVFIAVKAAIIFSSGPSLGLTRAQAARVAFTLSGGGEFAFVLFQLSEDLGVFSPTVSKILSASVIISMSLTPILGEIGSFAGNTLEAQSSDVRADGLTFDEEMKLFDQIDVDNSGTIDIDELREVLIRLNFPYSAIANVFENFDANDDGVIDQKEWREGIENGLLAQACETGGKSEEGLSESVVAFTDDAIVICGFGEVGQSIYRMISDSSRMNGSRCSNVVCFDLNPSRVVSGTLYGAPVVFGDGARIELLKAAGIRNPRAAIVTYASDDRKRDATMRLRSCLPTGTPIYVYGGKTHIEKDLIDAGATEVINETLESSLRFATLVGACKTSEDVSKLRRLSMEPFLIEQEQRDSDDDELEQPRGRGGLSEQALLDLAEEIGCSRSFLDEQYELFQSVAGDGDSVQITELRDYWMRQGRDGPSDGSQLEACLRLRDQDGEGKITFVDYLRASCKCEEVSKRRNTTT